MNTRQAQYVEVSRHPAPSVEYGSLTRQPASVSIDNVVLVTPDEYSGDYVVTPSSTEQVIPIRGKSASANITINPIPNNYGRIEFDGSTLSVI